MKNYTAQIDKFIDEQAIKIVRAYDNTLSNEEARFKIGYLIAKKALKAVYDEGFAQGVHIQRELQ